MYHYLFFAGTLAALSTKSGVPPKAVPVRAVQQSLLQAKAYLMPYIDVQPHHPHFTAVQKIGATGILKGKGIPYQWANQTWFYPDSLVSTAALKKDLAPFNNTTFDFTGETLSIKEAINIAAGLKRAWFAKNVTEGATTPTEIIRKKWHAWGLQQFDPARKITRLELTVLLNDTVDPFSMKAVNHKGVFTLLSNFSLKQ